ncbi:hypothetical protein Tco_0903445 [Tanacetum coccineum]
MPLRVMTRGAGRPAAAPRGGGMGGRVGRGGRRVREPRRRNIKPTVYTRLIEKMESVQDMSGCRDNQKVKYTIGSFVGKALTWWNSHIHIRGREAAIGHAANTDRFHELARLVPHLVTAENKRIKRYIYGLAPQIQGMVAATEPTTIRKAVQIAGTLIDEAIRNGSLKKNPKKRRNEGEPSKDRNVRDDNKRSRTVSAFVTTLFDSGADYSFVSTTFMPLLGMEPNALGFSYEIEIASGQLVEIDKVIKGCKLEIEVRIPLPDGKVLRVIGERPEEKMRHVMSAKAKEQKQEEIVVVIDFPKVFPDDLSGLPPIREIEFQIELVLGVILVAKSPYRLAPFKMKELSGSTQRTPRQRFHSTKLIALGGGNQYYLLRRMMDPLEYVLIIES